MPNALRAPSLEAFEKDKGMQSTYALPGLAYLLA